MNTAEITTKTTIAKRSLNSAICCHLDLIELNLFHNGFALHSPESFGTTQSIYSCKIEKPMRILILCV